MVRSLLLFILQAIPETFDIASQTEWKYPKNANTQYEYRAFSTEQQTTEMKTDNMNTFLTDVRPRFEEALQQNEIMNVFYDDWTSLSSGKSCVARFKILGAITAGNGPIVMTDIQV